MPEAQGVGQAVLRQGSTASQQFLERLDVTILNPVQFPPAQNTFKMDANGIWNAIYIPSTGSIRCTIV